MLASPYGALGRSNCRLLDIKNTTYENITNLYTVNRKKVTLLFLNNYVKSRPIL